MDPAQGARVQNGEFFSGLASIGFLPSQQYHMGLWATFSSSNKIEGVNPFSI